MSAPLATDVTRSFAVFVFIVVTFVIAFVFKLIPPNIEEVPSDFRKGPPVKVLATIPESPITFADTKLGKFPVIPVLVLLTISFVNLEFIVPAIDAFEYKV